MTPQFPATAELRTPAHIEIIDPPNKLRQETKTKKNPGTLHGNESDDPAKLPSLAVPESDSDGNGCLTPLICFWQFAADPHAGRGLPLDPNFSEMFQGAMDDLIFRYDPPPPSLDPTLHAPGN
jgi:hypothetical protein